MLFHKEEKVKVSFDKPFIAAYAEGGFCEDEVPDYELTRDGKWWVRVGLIDICWGTRVECRDGTAMVNGSLYVYRQRADESPLRGKGTEPGCAGSVTYVYECEWIGERLVGLVPAVRPALIKEIEGVAREAEVFELKGLLESIEFYADSGAAAPDPRLTGLCNVINKICADNFLTPDLFRARCVERVNN